MATENSDSTVRVSNWTLATGTQPRQRSVASAHPTSTKRALRKVVVVTNRPFRLAVESAVNLKDYDIVFLESTGHAYSQIKRVAPALVIVCVEMDDIDGFQVLSMLKFDENTSRIPLMTYTTAEEARRGTAKKTKPNHNAGGIIVNPPRR